MRKHMKKIMAAVMTLALLINSSGTVSAKSLMKKDYTYNSMSELKNEIRQIYKDKTINANERKQLEQNTDPRVIELYARQELERIFEDNNDLLGEFALGKSDSETKTVEYENGTKVIVTIEDHKEQTLGEKVLTGINELTAVKASAQSTSSQVTKSYGNRYCSAEFVVLMPIGSMTLYMENHYYLGSKGIKERYGKSDVSYLCVGGQASAGDCVITDSKATKPGASNTDMYFKTNVQFASSLTNFGYSVYMYSTLKFININYSTKRITLKQTFHT